jgi:hypothetical protein
MSGGDLGISKIVRGLEALKDGMNETYLGSHPSKLALMADTAVALDQVLGSELSTCESTMLKVFPPAIQ